MNVIIPAAGLGTRFSEAGYTVSKPLVPVDGIPMISRVMSNLRPSTPHRFVIVSRMSDDELRPLLAEDDVTVHLETETEGAVDTILRASAHLTSEPLLLANCDQLCSIDIDKFIASASHVDGSIVTFHSNKPHHSYIETEDVYGHDFVTRIVEKEVISSLAVTGIYLFRHGSDFLEYAKQVIHADDRVRNEYYVSSVIARMLADGMAFTAYDAPSVSLGTPEELQLFEVTAAVTKAVL